MKAIACIILLILMTHFSIAQCLTGNCKNGKGRFDYGWCVYEGEFKNEKPDGQGKMKYDDYIYEGSFKDGVEDGTGIITYKDGRKEEVRYRQGKKLDYKPDPVSNGEYKPLQGRDVNCIDGDCNDGFGTYAFPSGNKYTGNFKSRKREGEGTFYFNNGEKFKGRFHNDQFSSGTYTFSNGAVYTGSYDEQGNVLNGQYVMNGRSISVLSGKAVIPKIEYKPQPSSTATAKTTAKPKMPVLNWGSSSKSDYSQQAAASVDKMLDRMNRPTYTHW